jgi:glycine/D-amino acid oxidase-like deaminating enzyme
LRTALLSRFGGSQPATVTAVEPPGTVRLDDGTRVSADVVVLATGAWTAAVLRASGIPAALRTKHIQVCRYRAYHPGLPAFVDETSGLYGRPDEPGVVLLGLPSDRWDVDPAGPVADPALEARVRATAAERLPGVGLRPTGRVVSAADCYSEPAGLALRPAGRGLWTFSGGSGAAAKIALAASRFAAAELTTTMTYTGG